MPSRKSSLKRMHTDRKKGLHNKGIRSELKTYTKKLRELIQKEDIEGARSLLPAYSSKLDKAAKRRIIHPNRAAGHKSKFSKKIASC